MTARYRLDPAQSHFTARAFASGLLSFVGHSPTFAVRDFRGEVRLDGPEVRVVGLELRLNADAVQLTGNFSNSDRLEIEGRMRREVLETAAHPEISFRGVEFAVSPISRGRYRLRVGGELSLRGVTRPLRLDPELQVLDDALRLLGECQVRLSDYRISPVTALGGTIRLKDEVKLSFDVIGISEAT